MDRQRPTTEDDAVQTDLQASRRQFGTLLRTTRAARELPLDEIARVTRIPLRSLEHLEHGRFDLLPADVFVRGFLRSYAQCVGLDADDIVRRYAACGLTPAPVASPQAEALLQSMRSLAPSAAAASSARVLPVGDSEPRCLVLSEADTADGTADDNAAFASQDAQTVELADGDAAVAAPASRASRTAQLPRQAEMTTAAAPSLKTASVVAGLMASSPRTARTDDGNVAVEAPAAEATQAVEVSTEVAVAAVAAVELVSQSVAPPRDANGQKGHNGAKKNKKRRGKKRRTARGTGTGADTVVVAKTLVVAEPVAAVVQVDALVEPNPVVDLAATPSVAVDATAGGAAFASNDAAASLVPTVDGELSESDANATVDPVRKRVDAITVSPAVADAVAAPRVAAVVQPIPTLVIDDDDPESAELERSQRSEREPTWRAFIPPVLLDRDDQGHRGTLTLAVIILVIVATLTMSYLLRRPSTGGDGVTLNNTGKLEQTA